MKQARGASSRRGFYLALLLVAVAGVAGILWATRRASETTIVTVPTTPPDSSAPGYVRGNPAAPVEIVEYADFECPGCAQFALVTAPDVMTRIVDAGLARYRLYDFPVNSSHQNSPAASLAASCANDQQKFWEMHDLLFQGQTDWNTLVTNDPKPIFRGYATQLGLDVAAWEKCFDDRKYVGRIAAHVAQAGRAQVRSTPSFMIGNKMVDGVQPYDVIKALVDSARAAAGVTAPASGAAPPGR